MYLDSVSIEAANDENGNAGYRIRSIYKGYNGKTAQTLRMYSGFIADRGTAKDWLAYFSNHLA